MKSADWFRHDVNARNDIKCAKLRKLHGWHAYGIFWAIVEMLAAEGNHKLPMSDVESVALILDFDPALFAVFFDLHLLVNDGEWFWSESLCSRLQALNERREKQSEGGKRSAEIRAAKATENKVTCKQPEKTKASNFEVSSKLLASNLQGASRSREEQRRVEQSRAEEKRKEKPAPLRRDLHPDALALSAELLNAIRQTAPHLKEPNLTAWAQEMDKMIRLDDRAPGGIRNIISLIPADSFWSGVILSPKNLRKNFDKLVVALRRPAMTQYEKNQQLFARWEKEIADEENESGAEGVASVRGGVAGEVRDDGKPQGDLVEAAGRIR